MNPWGVHKTIGVILVSLLFVFAAAVLWLLSQPPAHDCATHCSTDPQKIHAAKVVVEPWLGQHQVFGIFMVPLRYWSGRTYSGTISVESYVSEFTPDAQPQYHQIDDVVAKPGYYLIRGYVPTRIALWFLIRGQFGGLRSRCNWTLELSKRSK